MINKKNMEEKFHDLDHIQEDELESEEFGTRISKKKVFIIIVFLVVALIISAAVIWFFVFSQHDTIPEKGLVVQKTIETPSKSPEAEDENFFQDIVQLELFERIRLKDDANMSMITMKIALELMDVKDKKQLVIMTPELRRIVEEQAGRYTWLELRSPEGKIKFKYELLQKMNSQLNRIMIRNVFFTYFLMQ